MAIQRISVRGLRNLRSVELDNLGQVNVISGPNGSGKTSLLEAIYLLGMGRSFRGVKTSPLVSNDLDSLVVYGDVLGAGGQHHTLGIQKGRDGRQQAKIDRRPVAGLVEMARELPLQLLDSDAFSLIDGGPKTRRQFMDWGVFHVKPPFLEVWRRTQRALKQRNSLLRARRGGTSDALDRGRILGLPASLGGGDFDAWEKELISGADQLDLMRGQYLEMLKPHLLQKLQAFSDLPELSLEYRRGWRADSSLIDLLAAGRQRDRELGYTQVGPHRATLELKVDGYFAADVLSRGQKKLVVASLKLAQGACLAEATGRSGVYLVDDLPAELDFEHRKTFSRLLAGLGSQVFITSVDADMVKGSILMDFWPQQDEIRWFHVEQGEYRCLNR